MEKINEDAPGFIICNSDMALTLMENWVGKEITPESLNQALVICECIPAGTAYAIEVDPLLEFIDKNGACYQLKTE